MRTDYTTTLLLLLMASTVNGQLNFDGFKQVYPISEDAYLGYKSSYVKSESIFLEASPNVRYSFFNNIMKGLMSDSTHVSAWYLMVKPHWRMYQEKSIPVKTPSNQVRLGTQHLWRVHGDNFIAFSVESGHYSNGQNGCSFSELYQDQTPQCDSIYRLITPQTNLSEMLNRRSGNFSTNLTEVNLNYRFNVRTDSDDYDIPLCVHSIRVGYTLYHNKMFGILNIGGFSDADIKIYGRHRFTAGYEFTKRWFKTIKVKDEFGIERKQKNERRFSGQFFLEAISGAHPFVKPLRAEMKATLFPFKNMTDIGFYFSLQTGHDNYNFRFVDAATVFSLGVTWVHFPPFTIKR